MVKEESRLSSEAERTDTFTVLRFTGDIDIQTLENAKTALQNEIDAGYTRCIIDLDEVNYMDSSGIGFLIGALKQLEGIDGQLRISRLNTYLSGLFRLLHLNEILRISDTVHSAVSSLEKPA